MLFSTKGLQLILLGAVATATDAADKRDGNLRRRTIAKRGLYYGTPNIPDPTPSPTSAPTPTPTVSWLWDNDAWNDDAPKVETDKPTLKPTSKWGSDGWAPPANTPVGSSPTKGSTKKSKSSSGALTTKKSKKSGDSNKSKKSKGADKSKKTKGTDKSKKSKITKTVTISEVDAPNFAIFHHKKTTTGGNAPIEPPQVEVSNWDDDGWKKPAELERKWNDDGWTPPEIASPTPEPTPKPTGWRSDGHPTPKPTVVQIQTDAPTQWKNDGHQPTPNPTGAPTTEPTKLPTSSPTLSPTDSPSKAPTNSPTLAPIKPIITESPTKEHSGHPSASPSASPSVNTPVPSVSSSPTPCGMKWHPNKEYTVCTNDMIYPPFWDFPDNVDKYFYETLTECCQAVFGTPECPYKDDCAPTATPTEEPTSTPTQAPTDCYGRKFHPNFGFSICSNGSGNYPSMWENPEMIDSYFYESLEECCLGVFGTSTCDHEDICTPTSTPSSAPSIHSSNTPSLSPTELPTYSPVNAIITPAPTPSPTTCEERTWHPAKGFHMCVNDFDYPPFWTSTPAMEAQYFYHSLEECCQGVFNTSTCPYIDSCAPTDSPTSSPTEVPSMPPSKPPTPAPSPGPTKNPTEQPSKTPTDSPTSSPIVTIVTPSPSSSPTSCEERKWHINSDGTKCSNGDEYPLMGNVDLDHDNYESIEECCSAIFGTNVCQWEDICNTLTPSISPTPKPTDIPTAAPVITIITSTPTASPTNEPTSSPSRAPTNVPTSSPSSNPTPAPTSSPTEGPTRDPTQEPTPSPTEEPTSQPTPSPTLNPTTPSPTSCEQRKFCLADSGSVCSNEFDCTGSEGVFDTLEDCCIALSGASSCEHVDICAPTASPIVSPTASPTESPTTPAPSFGATPTVSKEVSGPPTEDQDRQDEDFDVSEIASNDFANGTYRKEVEKECHRVWGGNPQVCVYVCTEFTTIFEGSSNTPLEEFAKTTETDCP